MVEFMRSLCVADRIKPTGHPTISYVVLIIIGVP
jgi:hypothetical protein